MIKKLFKRVVMKLCALAGVKTLADQVKVNVSHPHHAEGFNQKNFYLTPLIANIAKWHHERNLVLGSDDKSQFAKLIQEVGELSDSLCKGLDIRDDIGDIIVVLINLCERNNVSLQECVGQAWHDIKDRKGQMRDGVFIKEADL